MKGSTLVLTNATAPKASYTLLQIINIAELSLLLLRTIASPAHLYNWLRNSLL